MDCEEREDLKSTIQALEMEVQRLKNSMTFGGIIADPLKNTVEYHGQYLLPEQIADIEKNDKILHLENKLEELKRDKQFLEQQAELNDIEDHDVSVAEAAKEILIAEVEELRMGRAELQLESDTKTTQLARTTALIRTQQARIHELNRRLGIAQVPDPERMTITQNRVNQYFNQFNGAVQGAVGVAEDQEGASSLEPGTGAPKADA